MIIMKNYLIKKALEKQMKINEICKVYKCSPNKVIKIKREGFLKIDKIREIIYKIREENPFFTLSDIRKYLISHYNIKISTSNIYYKLQKEELDNETREFFEMLIEEGRFSELSKIIKFYKISYLKNLKILEKIPDEYLDENNFVEKVIGLCEDYKLNDEIKLAYLEKLEKMLRKRRGKYSFYILLELKIYLLIHLLKYEEAKELYYNYINEIIRLPKYTKMNLLFTFANLQYIYPEIGYKILSIVRKYKLNDEMSEVLKTLYKNLGYNYKSIEMKKDITDDFSLGNYRNFIKHSNKYEPKLIGNRLVLKCNRLISRLLIGNISNISQKINEIEKEIERRKVSIENFNVILAIKYALDNNYEKSKEVLRACKTRTLKCIGDNDFNNLSKYRKQELMLKYFSKSNIKAAVNIARRYGNFYNLHLYSILLNKSIRILRRYEEFKDIVKILEYRDLKRISIRAYFLRRKPVIYIGYQKFEFSKISKSILFLLFVMLNKGKVHINDIKDEGISKNVRSMVYGINRKFKWKILSFKSGYIFLNCSFYLDILDFLNKKDRKIYRYFPFYRFVDKYSFIHRLWFRIYSLNQKLSFDAMPTSSK
ncbi:MAG: hypothetical protein N2504_01180 [candidate division WOR-3 bacterium]|nr:hypothetical protein [candidate division WOR-3 bacterium]